MFDKAIRSELAHWPGVNLEYRDRAKHREAVFTFNGKSRFVILPKTTSDSQRAPKNTVRDMRRQLVAIRAERRDVVPISKRQKQQEAENMATRAVAKLGITESNIALAIPTKSALFKEFATPKGIGRSYWKFELRSNPDPQGDPYFAVVRVPDPPAGQRHGGIAKGSFIKISSQYNISISPKALPAIEQLGTFGVTPIEVFEHSDGVIVFKVPKERKPVMLRGAKRREAEKQTKPTAEATVEPAPQPQMASEEHPPAPTIPLAPNGQRPTPVILQAAPQAVSLERAIDIINNAKKKMGDNLRLSISEGGYVAAVAKYGRRD